MKKNITLRAWDILRNRMIEENLGTLGNAKKLYWSWAMREAYSQVGPKKKARVDVLRANFLTMEAEERIAALEKMEADIDLYDDEEVIPFGIYKGTLRRIAEVKIHALKSLLGMKLGAA